MIMDLFDALDSDGFRQSMFGLGVVTLVLATGLIIVAFAFYGRTRDIYGTTSEKQRWTLLMGTWRDSLLMTVLYSAEALAYRFAEFQAMAQMQPSNILLYAPVMQPVFSLAIQVLIFAIAIMRVIVISRWLASQRDAP